MTLEHYVNSTHNLIETILFLLHDQNSEIDYESKIIARTAIAKAQGK